MSTVLETLFTANTTVANSPFKDVRGWKNLSFQVTGMVSGDVIKLQGSNDDFKVVAAASLVFTDIPENITASGIYWLDQPTPALIRVARTAITGGGSVTVKMAGERGD